MALRDAMKPPVGFLAFPDRRIFLNPMVTKIAAREYGSSSLMLHGRTGRRTPAFSRSPTECDDLRDLRPRDMIDLQSFIWVQESDEYEE